MLETHVQRRNPWAWVPTLYLAEGTPYVVVMTVAVVLYKGLGISNTDIAVFTSWLYLPWVIKPLWSPVVDILKTRRQWIWVVQLLIGAAFAGVALAIQAPNFFRYTLAFFWLLAFSSATHDIAIDGYYLLAADEREQAFFVGIRSTFYRIAMVFGQGLLVIFAGFIQDRTSLPAAKLEVAARPGAAIVREFPSPALPVAPSDGPLRIVASPESLEISPEPRASGEISALLALAKSNNIAGGFSQPDKPPPPPSAWARFTASIEAAIRARFGQRAKPAATKGNIGLLAIHLSKPPGREVVVTLGSKVGFGLGGGDEKNFSVVEGGRLVFNDHNWNRTAFAVVQADRTLNAAARAALELRSGNLPFAWSMTFLVLAGLFVVFGVYHCLFLPFPASDRPGAAVSAGHLGAEFMRTFAAFFAKDRIVVLLLFLLLYRFAEAQLVKMVAPFLLDTRESGGLGLTTGQVGLAYGTVGIAALTCGGLLGGMLAARDGLKRWLWPMVLAIHLPDVVFIYLAWSQTGNFWLINLCVGIDQFGYGFGFTAYMLYMIRIARGAHQTAHYAICTGFMALGMMVPGFFSGWLQDMIGYRNFFIWVLLATIPGFVVVALIPLEAEFGRKTAAAPEPGKELAAAGKIDGS